MNGNEKKRAWHHSRASHREQHRGVGGGRGGGRGGRRGGAGGSKNPRRGGPGVLLTCDGGRERKCRIEGLDILRHYYYASLEKMEDGSGGDEKEDDSESRGASKNDDAGPTAAPSADGERRELSLEEEIALLKGGASAEEVLRGPDGAADGTDRGGKRKIPFAVYDTGCKGTVFVMCTLPHCNLVPALRHGVVGDDEVKDETRKDTRAAVDDAEDNEGKTIPKKRKAESQGENKEENKEDEEVPPTPPWDPLDTVHRIMDDLSHPTTPSVSDAPESRFVTRMIPIQATCFASLEEIQPTARSLLDRYLFRDIVAEGKKKATFGITFKRRNCAHLKRGGVIDVVAGVVEELRKTCTVGESGGSEKQDVAPSVPELSVDLANPDYTIQIEVCKTLCGMSVVPRITSFHKFNLFAMRQQNEDDDD